VKYFEDIAVGEVWNLGRYEVTAEEIMAFAGKYDPQPFHTDPEAAKQSFFGGLIASGWHTNAMLMRLLADTIRRQELASVGAPGIDRCRWLAPVRPGDTLHARTTVAAARRSRSRPYGLVTCHTEVRNQDDATVCLMEGIGLYACRPEAEDAA
jgi:acyl dehydratase